MVHTCTHLGKDEKTKRNLYLFTLKTSLWKRSQDIFPYSVSKQNHVTTHPEFIFLTCCHLIL